MNDSPIKDAAKRKNRSRSEALVTLTGLCILFGVLVIVLDFFDVGFFDYRGPGAAMIIFGLGIFTLVFEALKTGALPMVRGFIIRESLPPVFWVSVAIYALAGVTMIVVGCLSIFDIIER